MHTTAKQRAVAMQIKRSRALGLLTDQPSKRDRQRMALLREIERRRLEKEARQ